MEAKLRLLSYSLPAALRGEEIQRILRSLLCALEDYTVDERGDVGSWIRVSALHGIGSISYDLFEEPSIRSTLLEQCLPPELYFEAFAAMLKQGSERLDAVRQEAGAQITSLIAFHSKFAAADTPFARWHPPGFDRLSAAFLGFAFSSGRCRRLN